MSAVAWLPAAAGTVVAAVAAVADGALFAEPAAPVSSAERPPFTPPAVMARAVPAREATHRALAAARLLGHLVAGGAVTVALDLPGEGRLGRILALVGLGIATVLVAETLARLIGDALGERAGQRLAPITRRIERIAAPIVALGSWVDGLVADGGRADEGPQERRDEAAAQFREVIATEPDVSGEERQLLLGVFEFGETTVEEVMVPRVDIMGIERDTPWSEMLDRVRSARHSRVPIFEGTVDEIVGILYVKDLLPSILIEEEPAAGWPSLMRPPVFIPASKRIADLLREFRLQRRHIAIVADEYGGTAGLVTIEDVLEELVGEIRDEYDEEERLVESEEDTRFWVSGRLTLDDLSQALGYDFTHDDVTTMGGLVLELVGRVPRNGETLTIGPFKVIVERVVRRKIERVFLERLPAGPDDAAREAAS